MENMKVRFFNPGKWYKQHKKEINREINRVLSNGDLILKRDVFDFENNLSKFVGTKYAIGVSSGTDAIYMCIKYLNPETVNVPFYTFKSTVGAVISSGSLPVFNKESKVSIIAHIAGKLEHIPRGIVIEDACQALGAVKNPKTFAQCWSFYPAKILGSYGDAGAITTNDREFYDWCIGYRNHFKEDNKDWGGNHRMDNIQAAILNVKFKYLKENIKRRKEIAKMYDKGLKGILGVKVDTERKVYQDYIIEVGNKRDKLYSYLKKNGIETLKNEYPFPIEKPIDNLVYESTTLRLPCNEILKNEEVEYIIKKINGFDYI